MVFTDKNGEEMIRKNPIETRKGLIVYTDEEGHWYLKFPDDTERLDCNNFEFISFMTALMLNGGNIDEAYGKVWR